MTTLLALALAVELGAAAPEDLKPCPKPERIKNAAPIKQSRVLVVHPVLKAKPKPPQPIIDCAEGAPPPAILTLIPAEELPGNFSPAVPDSFQALSLALAEAPAPDAPVLEDEPADAPVIGSFTSYVGVVRLPAIAPAVPEPSTWALLAGGLAFAALKRRKA